jgi:hypothetical protein
LTAIPSIDAAGDALTRLVFNRDEKRTRAVALPPRVIELGAGRALMPIDPASGGSWIGVNDRGLGACVLNSTQGLQHDGTRTSRGQLVPLLLSCDSLPAAQSLLRQLDADRFPAFRIVAFTARQCVVASSDGRSIAVDESKPWPVRFMMASSGLGDHLVQQPRRELWQRTLARSADDLAAQSLFHRTHEPEHGALSPLMARVDARTLSRVTLDLTLNFAHLTYEPLGDGLRPLDVSTHAWAFTELAR